MKFENVPTYNIPHLEHKARLVLTETLGPDLAVPVEVELILERMPGVFFDLWPGLRDNHCTEGMVCRDTQTGEICVFVDAGLADNLPNRYRMTVAEELGHVILHRDIIEQAQSPKDFVELQRHDLWHHMERNAKRFACAILMPGDFVLQHARVWYPQLVHVAGFDNADAILNTMAAKLAKEFEVSPQSMRIRLKEYPAKIVDRVTSAMQEKLDYI